MKASAWLLRSALAVMVFLPWAGARAAVIPTLFSTGVDSRGVVLPDGAAEQHYRFATTDSVPTSATGPVSSTSIIVFQQTNAATPGNWTGDSTTSAWIGPNNPDRRINPPGRYYYSTIFDLTGFDPATARIVGYMSGDDVVANVRLNVTQTPVITNYDPADRTAGYTRPYMFTLDHGFVAGLNFLEFRVDNGVDPATGSETATGFRAQLLSDAAVLVPEPASMAVLGAGLLGAGLLGAGRRRRG